MANGQPVPTVAGHSPTLDGMCTAAAGASACASGVCDTDNLCGLANGDGPCDMTTGTTVCRSMACSNNNLCEPSGGCNVDADCATGNWCLESTHTCKPTLSNGTPLPTDASHMSPKLDGTCTTAAATLVCTSGVCDTKDNECGYANGDGPCTGGNGDLVCRSGNCGSNGTCVGCTMDSQCSGATPVCNTTSGLCVQCTSSTQCSSGTPVCDATSSTCVPCNGDNGSTASDPCSTTSEPFCFLSGSMMGQCGKCATDSDCQGHTGDICDTTSGLCVTGCDSDAQCGATQWCNNPPGAAGTCVPKLSNGTPLPGTPSDVSTCTTAVGMRVCVSGVCDTKDNACGYANGDGPCGGNAQCRDNTCDPSTMTCMPSTSSSSSSGSAGMCVTDSDCPSSEFCQGGNCVPLLPIGKACTRSSQCQSDDCDQNVCSTVIGSGNGVICAARGTADTSGGSGPAGLLGLMFVATGLARRSRRRRG